MLIFYFFLYSLIISQVIGLEITEKDAMEKTDRYISVSSHRIEITGRLADGTCCNSNEDTTCNFCKYKYHYLQIERTDKNGVKKSFEITSATSSPYTYLVSKVFPYITSEHKFFQLRFFFGTTLMDEWVIQDSSIVGTYSWNGAWGNYGNVKIFLSLQFISVRQYNAYASFNIRIDRIKWVSKTYSDGTYCNIDSNNTHIRACQFYVSVTTENTQVWKSGISAYSGFDQSSYGLKWESGITTDKMFKDNLDMKLEVHESDSDRLIDTIDVKSLQLMPMQLYEKTSMYGNNNKLSLDFSLRYECEGYSGFNCKYFCHQNTSLVRCRSDNGKKFCMNGASNPPICDTHSDPCNISPCENEGICIPLKNATACKCNGVYKGAYCEIPNCVQACKNGKCLKNKCICDDKFEGDTCDTILCSNAESSYCKNGGICKKTNGTLFCICSSATTGKTCEEPKCKFECDFGECVLTTNNVQPSAFCKCLPEFSGETCGIRKTLALRQNSEQTIYPIIISILVVLLIAELKLLLNYWISNGSIFTTADSQNKNDATDAEQEGSNAF